MKTLTGLDIARIMEERYKAPGRGKIPG